MPELLRAAEPDAVVVMGTSILRPAVLEAAGPVILNVHGGFLPHYRGNHCFFWALYDARHDLIGTTIHFVDPGIDTGDIIEIVTTTVAADDNAETLYCRAELLAIERLAHWLRQLEAGVAYRASRSLARGEPTASAIASRGTSWRSGPAAAGPSGGPRPAPSRLHLPSPLAY